MRGVVNPDLEATLPVQLHGPTGQRLEVVAVIDTGYSGALSLSGTVIAALGLSSLSSRMVRLADRSTRVLNSYEADVLWDGQRRAIRILALESDPLIGTALLKGHSLSVDFTDGGDVTIEVRP